MKIKEIIPEYINYMHAIGRSPCTIRNTGFILKSFARYLEKERVYDVEGLTRDVLEDYQEELAFSLTAKGKPLSLRSQIKKLCTVKGLTGFLKERDYLVNNSGDRLKLPKEPQRLPRSILDRLEIKALLKAPDLRTNTGYRDRVLLEILYDTGIRRAELSHIKLSDLDLNAGYVKVLGKGNKERVVPLSQKVCEIIQSYILSVRPSLLRDEEEGWLILNDIGGQIKNHTVWHIVKRCSRLAHIRKNVTTHTFRHACATHMLKNGAPIRHLQEMLGHESLESTQIYTHVTINDLKEVHAKYHPGESLK